MHGVSPLADAGLWETWTLGEELYHGCRCRVANPGMAHTP